MVDRPTSGSYYWSSWRFTEGTAKTNGPTEGNEKGGRAGKQPAEKTKPLDGCSETDNISNGSDGNASDTASQEACIYIYR